MEYILSYNKNFLKNTDVYTIYAKILLGFEGVL